MAYTQEQYHKYNDEKFRVVNVTNAHELIAQLRLSNPEWYIDTSEGNRPKDEEWERRWFFRGQANLDWRVTPSAWRESSGLPNLYQLGQVYVRQVDAGIDRIKSSVGEDIKNKTYWSRLNHVAKQIVLEIVLVQDFLNLAESIGHPIPPTKLTSIQLNPTYIDQIIHDLYHQTEEGIHRTIWLDEGFTLAQHYGIATRLLDFTHQPLYAAYFAATGALDILPRNGYFCIYAFSNLFFRGKYIVEIPTSRSRNEFLRSQEGVLITDLQADDFYIENGFYPDLMASLFDMGAYPNTAFSPMKFVVPVKLAPRAVQF